MSRAPTPISYIKLIVDLSLRQYLALKIVVAPAWAPVVSVKTGRLSKVRDDKVDLIWWWVREIPLPRPIAHTDVENFMPRGLHTSYDVGLGIDENDP